MDLKRRTRSMGDEEADTSKKIRLCQTIQPQVLLNRCDNNPPIITSAQDEEQQEFVPSTEDEEQRQEDLQPMEGQKEKKKRKKYDAVTFDGHTFHRNSSAKDGATIYLDCAGKKEYTCKAKLTGKRNPDGTYTYTPNKAEHSHILDIREVEAKARVNTAKQNAALSNKSIRELYSDAVAGATAEVLGQMPSQATFSKSMSDQRKGNHPTAPQSVEELVLPEEKTNSGEEFVLFDSGSGKKNRIIMFASETTLNFLAKCQTMFMDGTVSSGPMLFDQVYVIHGLHNGFKTPCVFVLCTNKNTKTYAKIFSVLKSRLPGFKPKQINCDFELAAIKAAKDAFPGSKVQACYFHLAQSLVRNINNRNLKKRYEKDEKFASEIRQMQAVAFLPVDKVIESWEKFITYSTTLNPTEQEKNPDIAYFVHEYFAKYYIGTLNKDGTRKRPRFAITLWNVHESTLTDVARSNNVAEAWNKSFGQMTGAQRPTIFKYIDSLKSEESLSRKKILDCDSGRDAPKQRPKHALRDNAIKTSVLMYQKAIEEAEPNDEEEEDETDGEADESADESAVEEIDENEDSESDQEMPDEEDENENEEMSDEEEGTSDEEDDNHEREERSKWMESPEKKLLEAISINSRL